MSMDVVETTLEAYRPDISIVIPLYRDAAALPTLLERLDPVVRGLDGEVELVLVDDGSPDGTGAAAIELTADYPHRTTVVKLLRNFGQHPAVFAGFAHARGKVVVTLDSDFQYPPEEIRHLVEGLDDEYLVVSGSRLSRNDPWGRRQITRFLSWWLSRRTGVKLADYGSMFKAYDRTVIEALLAFKERHRFIPALVGWLGFPVKEISVTHLPRGEQGSRYRLGPLLDMFLDVITGYSTFPLRIVSWLGVAGAALGFVGTAAFLVYRIAVGAGVSGLVSAFALIFFMLGLQLVVLALLGEYVGRVYVEAKQRPYYLIDKVVQNQ